MFMQKYQEFYALIVRQVQMFFHLFNKIVNFEEHTRILTL